MTNLPTLTTADLTPNQPTITTSATNSWTVHLGPVKATISYDDTEAWSTIYVDDGLAESVDPQLAALAEQERNLDDDRWLDRGESSDVDDLYDRLNERISTVKTMIAVAVLPKLADALDLHTRLLDKLEFSAYAGCTSCKCSPGVKAPYARRYGVFVQIFIERA